MLSCSVISNPLRPYTVAHQLPLSMEFSRQECWSKLPFPPPGDLSNPGTETESCSSCIGRHSLHCYAIWEAREVQREEVKMTGLEIGSRSWERSCLITPIYLHAIERRVICKLREGRGWRGDFRRMSKVTEGKMKRSWLRACKKITGQQQRYNWAKIPWVGPILTHAELPKYHIHSWRRHR